MNGSDRLLDGHQHDQAFDFTPAAEMDVVAQVPAAVGARGSFVAGTGAEHLDQFGRFFKTLAITEKWNLHVTPLNFGFDHGYSSKCRAKNRDRRIGALHNGIRLVRQIPFRDRRPTGGTEIVSI